MRRIVLDTNILVSALLSPQGNESLALRLALAGSFEIAVSPVILDEYREVLARPRFNIASPAIDALFAQFESHAIFVYPANRLQISPDEADNRFLECAETVGAEFLVTGNKRHFPRLWKETTIISAREFLEFVVPL